MSYWNVSWQWAIGGYALIGLLFVLLCWKRLARFTDDDEDES